MEGSRYKAYVVSDIHLGFEEECNKDYFDRFIDSLKEQKIDYLILLGDILEFWRRDNKKAIRENYEILKKLLDLPNVVNKIYVIGNHDLDLEVMTWSDEQEKGEAIDKRGLTKLECLTKLEGTGKKEQGFDYRLGKYDLPSINGKNYKFIHGYQLTEFGYSKLWFLWEDIYLCLCSLGEFGGWVASGIWKFIQGLNKKRTSPLVKELIESGQLGPEGFKVSKVESAKLFEKINELTPAEKQQLLESSILESLGKQGLFKLCKYTVLPPEKRRKKKNILEELIQEKLPQNKVFQHVSESLRIDFSELSNESKYSTMGADDEEKFRRNYAKVFGKELGDDDYLVFGHTHKSFKGSLVANVGCWLKGNENSYLTIDSNGDMNLHTF